MEKEGGHEEWSLKMWMNPSRVNRPEEGDLLTKGSALFGDLGSRSVLKRRPLATERDHSKRSRGQRTAYLFFYVSLSRGHC